MMVVLSTLVLLIRSLLLLYVCVFLIGLAHSIHIIVGYAYNMEAMPFKYRNLVATLIALLDKVILTITTLILKYHESNWIHIMIPGVIFSVVASIMSFVVYDSP